MITIGSSTPTPPESPWPLEGIEPASHDGVGFWDGTDPESGQRVGGFTGGLPCHALNPAGLVLRILRKTLRLTLRDGADLLGMRVSDLSGLETGRKRPVDAKAWEEIARKLAGLPGPSIFVASEALDVDLPSSSSGADQ